MRTTLLGYSYTPVRQKQYKRSNYNDKNTTQQSITFCGDSVKIVGVAGGVMAAAYLFTSAVAQTVLPGRLRSVIARENFIKSAITEIAKKEGKAQLRAVTNTLKNCTVDLNSLKQTARNENFFNAIFINKVEDAPMESFNDDFKKAIPDIVGKLSSAEDSKNVLKIENLNESISDDSKFYSTVFKKVDGLDPKILPDE